MAEKAQGIAWTRCRGRNGWDAPLDVPEDMGTEVLNMHFYQGGLGTKRGGSLSVGTLTGMSGIAQLYRFVPGQDETAAQLILVDRAATPTVRRLAASATVSGALTLTDALASGAELQMDFATLNGKCYIAYDSTVNRLHVFDPGLSTTSVRRAGMGTTAAPTLAELGGGGLSFTRAYKVAYTEQRSSVTVRRGALSAAASITISGKTGVAVTRPALLGEGETHWELYAADTTSGTYYLIATTAIATGSVNDTASTIDTTTAEPSAGANTPFPSVKYLYSDGKRLFGLGVWETTAGDSLAPKSGRVYFTPVLDSSAIHDDERVSNTTTMQGWIDLARNASGTDRAIGAMGNIVFAFQSKGIYALTPTENAEVPFRRTVYSTQLGAVSQRSLVQAEDEAGRPALYFLDPELGPYRIGFSGLQWLGKDVKDLWDTVNLAASNVVAHGVYHKSKSQVIWWIATGSSNDPDTAIVFDVTEGRSGLEGVRYGWVRWSGDYAAARCSVMFANTVGATMSRDLKPYIGAVSGTVLLKGDTAETTDNGTAFQAYVQSSAFPIEPLYQHKAITKSYVEAEAAEGVILRQTFIRGMGDETNRIAEVVLSSALGETEVFPKYEDAALVDAYAFQVRLGDPDARASGFTINRWYGAYERREDR